MWKESWSVFSVTDNFHKTQLAKQRWGNAYKIKTLLKHLLIEKNTKISFGVVSLQVVLFFAKDHLESVDFQAT